MEATGERLTEFFFRAEKKEDRVEKKVKKGTSFFKNVYFSS